MIPNFDAQYAAFRAPPFLPHCEDMLMMRPRVPRASITRATAREVTNVPRRFGKRRAIARPSPCSPPAPVIIATLPSRRPIDRPPRRRGCPDYRRGRAASRSIPAGPIFEQEAPMARTTQLTISLASKPGVLAQLARTLADARVNILSLSADAVSGRGKIRVIVDDATKAKRALRRGKYRF